MKLFVGADHNGFAVKKVLVDYLTKAGHDTEDIGDGTFDPNDDFPVFAAVAANKVLSSNDTEARAILVCGSGQGMVMAANRFKGIRAGLGYSIGAAQSIRNDEDSNILALPSELYKEDPATFLRIVDTWLQTPFAGAARYIRRNKALDQL